MRTFLSLASLALVALLIWLFLADGFHTSKAIEKSNSLSEGLSSGSQNRELGSQESVERTSLENGGILPEGREQSWQLKVVDSERRPQSAVSVWVWIGEEIFGPNNTNEEGIVSFPLSSGEGGFALVMPNSLAQFCKADFSQERAEFVIQGGREIVGRIQLPDRIPADYSIIMRTDSVPSPGFSDDIGYHLANGGVHVRKSIVKPEQDGSFRFVNLPDDWSGSLELSPEYLLVSSLPVGNVKRPNKVELKKIPPFLTLEAVAIPRFHGKVVSPQGRVGVGDVNISGSISFPLDRAARVINASSDERGEFLLNITPSNTETYLAWISGEVPAGPISAKLRLYVESPVKSGGNGRSVEIDLSSHNDPWDLGEISLAAIKEVPFAALDESGNPIIGAYGSAGIPSEPTNAQGLGTVFLGEDHSVVTCGAVGYAFTSIELGDAIPERLTFRLQKAPTLRVKFDFPANTDRSSLRVLVHTDQGPLFALLGGKGRSYANGLRKRMGLRIGGGYSGKKGEGKEFAIPNDGSFLDIWGLSANRDFRIFLLDTIGNKLVDIPVYLHEGERRELVLALDQDPQSFRGIVVNEHGEAVSGALVQLWTKDEGHGLGLYSQSDGSFTQEGVGTESIRLSVRHERYGLYWAEAIPVPLADDDPVTITLSEARSVRLWITDSDNRLQSDCFVRFGGELESVSSRVQEDGSYLLEGLPQEAVSISVWLGPWLGNYSLPASVLEHSIEIPAFSLASVQLTREEGASKENYQLQLVPVADLGLVGDQYRHFAGMGEAHIVLQQGDVQEDVQVVGLVPGEYLLFLWRWNLETHQFELHFQSKSYLLELGQPLSLVLNLDEL